MGPGGLIGTVCGAHAKLRVGGCNEFELADREMLDALATELLPFIVAHLPPRSWSAARRVNHSLHAAVMARALTPEGLALILAEINPSYSPVSFWFDSRDTCSLHLARSCFGLGPEEPPGRTVVPLARNCCKTTLALMAYAAKSRDMGELFARNTCHMNSG